MSTNITIGTVQSDDVAVGLRKDTAGGSFSDYMVHNHYDRDGGVYAAGLTSPDGYGGETTAVVRLRSPTQILMCEWTACRLGGAPLIPDPSAAPPGWRLLDIMLSHAMQSVGPSGNDPVYRISGVYVYACKKPSPSVFSDAVFPLAPWVAEGVFTRKIPLDKLSGVVMNDVRGTPDSGGIMGVVESQGQGKQGASFFVQRG